MATQHAAVTEAGMKLALAHQGVAWIVGVLDGLLRQQKHAQPTLASNPEPIPHPELSDPQQVTGPGVDLDPNQCRNDDRKLV